MLTLALAATVVGFVLLVVALITGNFWLAVACIIVCVVGLAVLLVDTLRSGSKSGGGVDDEPLFTIRDRDPQTRSAPLLDGDEQPASPLAGDQSGGHAAGSALAGDRPETDAAAGVPETADREPVDPSPAEDTSTSGLGSLVTPGAVAPDTDEAPPVTGDANDYIKSVTGSFPAQTPSGSWPVSAEPIPSAPETGGEPRRRDDGPDTGPIRATSPYVGRRRRGAAPDPAVPGQTGERPTGEHAAGEQPAGETGAPLDDVVAPDDAGIDDTGLEDAGVEDAVVVDETETETETDSDAGTDSGAGGQSQTFVVRDHTGPLPKITFTDEDG